MKQKVVLNITKGNLLKPIAGVNVIVHDDRNDRSGLTFLYYILPSTDSTYPV